MKFNRHKYNAKSTVKDSIRFASKSEAEHYKYLKLAQANGIVLFFLRQVPLHLPGNIRYVIDFMEFHADGTIRFIDVKGLDTALSKTKRQLVEAHYPIEITVIKKPMPFPAPRREPQDSLQSDINP